MKLLLIILSILSSSTASSVERNFHYLDRVRVISGFYKGCTGRIATEKYPSYGVDLVCVRGNRMNETFSWINENDLEKIGE